MRLWLDDCRPAPPGWAWAKTYGEAVALLETGEVTYASLDHDLADDVLADEKTGYDVVLWMEQHDVWPRDGLDCHSMNPVGRARIEQVIRKHRRHY